MRIGILVDSPVQWGPNSTLRAIESAARDAGYAISAFSISDDEESQIDTGVVELVTQGVDALCVIAPRASSLDLLRQQSTGLPTLVIKAESDPEMHTAAVDQRAGAMAAVMHLIELGHRRIAHLAGPLDWYDARAREQGWRDALIDAGLPLGPHDVGDWTSDCGYLFGRTFELDGATAVFAANDQMALGLVRALHDAGRRVPQDVSVVGFDDLPESSEFLPPLTTVHQDFAEVGRRLVEQVLRQVREGVYETGTRLVPTRLVERAITATPPG